MAAHRPLGCGGPGLATGWGGPFSSLPTLANRCSRPGVTVGPATTSGAHEKRHALLRVRATAVYWHIAAIRGQPRTLLPVFDGTLLEKWAVVAL